MTVKCSNCGAVLVSWENYHCKTCGPAGKPVFSSSGPAPPIARALTPVVKLNTEEQRAFVMDGKGIEKPIKSLEKTVPAKAHGPGYGKTRCSSCGAIKATRWPCKSCSSKKIPVDALERNLGDAFQCPECGKEFSTLIGLQRHVQRMHDKQLNVARFQCPACQRVFSSVEGLRAHAKTNHLPKGKRLDAIAKESSPVLDVDCNNLSISELQLAITRLQDVLARKKLKNEFTSMPCFSVAGGNNYARLE